MPLVFKRIWSIVTAILTALVIILAILFVGVRLFGLKPYTVLSGSMEPAYHVGSLIYVKEVDPESLEVRDPVTFYLDGQTVATHRIIELLPNGYIRTQGDANDTPDDPIHKSQVIGKPIFTVPYLGYLSAFLQTTVGKNVALIAIASLVLLMFIPELLFKKEKDEPEEENQ